MKKLFVMVGLVFSAVANAVDVYGVGQGDAEKIIKQYGKEITGLDLVIKAQMNKDVSAEQSKKLLDKAVSKRAALLQQITQQYGYLFVDFQTIYYPEQDKYYTTVEVIDRQHPERMRFVNAMPMAHQEKKTKASSLDLIDEMLTYGETSIDLLMHHEISPSASHCPVYHCSIGFDHPKLKPYLTRFNRGVIQQKSLVLKTLNEDKDPERRAAAAYLVGHFRDPHEIVSLLSVHVSDKDDGVRNDVMRVLGSTIEKAKIRNFDVTPFLEALDSPYTTDRNKALYILLVASESKASQRQIIKNSGERLVSLMRLTQPNNHDMAYLLLKKLSGKDFGSHNLLAWEKWALSQKAQMV